MPIAIGAGWGAGGGAGVDESNELGVKLIEAGTATGAGAGVVAAVRIEPVPVVDQSEAACQLEASVGAG